MFSKPRTIQSDRGEQIAHRAKNPTSRHMTDVRGATGCYYCWLGQYDKCRENCHLVPNRREADPSIAAMEASMAADPRTWNAFNGAAPTSTQNAAQQRTIFDLSQNYSPRSGRSRSVGSSYRGHHPAAATIRSLHEPIQFIPKYKHPRGSQLIDVTPYTKLSVAPDAHSYTSHHGRYVLKDSAIWDGGLVKHSSRLDASRSSSSSQPGGGWLQEGAERSTAGRLRDVITPHSRSPSPSATVRRGGSRHLPLVAEEAQLSAILSGRYNDAFAMPLPPTFMGA